MRNKSQPSLISAVVLALGLVLVGPASADKPEKFVANLAAGSANQNFVVNTNASGQANFTVLDNGSAIAYRVNVAGITNLWMAHIHVSPVAFGDGPIAFWFAPTTPGAPPDNVSQQIQGSMASGYIYTGNQLGGPLAGASVADLIAAMEENRAYVVVHTNDLDGSNDVDPNTTPLPAGDAPPGELRGQITPTAR